MPKFNLDKIIKANSSQAHAEKPVGVFIGGTSGIGLHTAYAFAKYTKEPTVYIIGRDATAGNNALQEIKKLNSSAKSYFLKHDLSLLSEVDALVKEIKEKDSKINTLCVSTGALTISDRDETSEGIDKKMALNYYSRWRAITQLLPLVQEAHKLNEPSRVINVLAPGTEGDLIMDDLQLKKNFGLRQVNVHFITMTSLATLKFARDYPGLSFTHVYPGIIKTGIMRGLPWWIRWPSKPLMFLFAESVDNAAERTFYEGYAGDDYKTGGHLLLANGEDIYEKKKQFLGEDKQEKVWEHTEQLFEKIRGSTSL